MKVSISSHVVSEIADGEMVLLDLEQGVYYGLDPVGSRLWSLFREGCDMERAQATLLAEFDVTAEQLATDLERIIGELLARGLVELAL